MHSLLKRSIAPSTLTSYRNSLRHYREFHSNYYPNKPLFPVSISQLAQFITVSHLKGLKSTSITSMVSAISYIHNIKGYRNPTEAFLIKKLLRATKLTSHSDNRKPITIPILKALLEALTLVTTTSTVLLLFRAMFLVAFFGLFRIGEITFSQRGSHNVIMRKNLELHKNKQSNSFAIIHLHSYKHSLGQRAKIALKQQQTPSLCPVKALRKYLRHNPNLKGQLFSLPCGNPVSSSFFRQMLKKCVRICKLPSSQYTAHSFRIGGATHAFTQGLSASQIKQLGRWKSTAYLKYIRPIGTAVKPKQPSVDC